VDDVAVERGGLAVGGLEGAVAGVLLGRQDQRDIVNPVSGGEAERIFGCVVD